MASSLAHGSQTCTRCTLRSLRGEDVLRPDVLVKQELYQWMFSALGLSAGIEETEGGWGPQMGSVGRLHCLTMTAAENPTPGDLALAPLVTCKLCLCEQSLDKMTTLQECRCIFCTAVSFPWCFHHMKKYEGKNYKSIGDISVAQEKPIYPMILLGRAIPRLDMIPNTILNAKSDSCWGLGKV